MCVRWDTIFQNSANSRLKRSMVRENTDLFFVTKRKQEVELFLRNFKIIYPSKCPFKYVAIIYIYMCVYICIYINKQDKASENCPN